MSLDTYYDELYQVFKTKHHDQYIEARNKIREKIKDISYTPQTSQFVPYPELTDPNFNKIIFNKKEFNRNQSKLEQVSYDEIANKMCASEEFNLTQNQRFNKDFLSPMTPYNSLLLFHGVGVGKTCTAISIAEQYHDIYKKKVLVILSSTLVDNFKKQLVDICTGTTYQDMILEKKNMPKDVLNKQINKLINERYEFMGYTELSNYIEELKKLKRLNTVFSDRLIIIDEAHNIRDTFDKKKISRSFKDLLDNVRGVKLVLMTATPMFNSAKEIVGLINLVLRNDKRKELKMGDLFNKDGVFIGADRLQEAIRGYVSFMRGENPYSFPFRLFPSVNGDTNLLKKYPTHDIYGKKIQSTIKYLEITCSTMSDQQKKLYDKIKTMIEIPSDDDEDEEEDSQTHNLQKTLQISNIVYPGGLYGEKGLNECFRKNKAGKYVYNDPTNNFLNGDKLDHYAPKIKRIIEYIKASQGLVFVYSRYYASGIIPLAIALEHAGFQKYNNKNIAELATGAAAAPAAPTYIILSKNKDLSPNNTKEIQVAKMKNSPIKVVIVSKIGTEGIDFKRIREIHLLDPWFNLNRAEQIIGRGVRFCSHIDLPLKQRNVTIYFHAAQYSEKEESVDLRVYRMAENKQRQIFDVERILKSNAVDCNLNKDVLSFPVDKFQKSIKIETSQQKVVDFAIGDKENSFICGFGKCTTTCQPNITSTKLDESTYDSRFIVDDVVVYKKYVAAVFLKGNYYTFEQILDALNAKYNVIDEDILLYTLQDMVERKHIFNKDVYLIYRGNKYIVQQYKLSDVRMTLEERDHVQKGQRAFVKLADLEAKTIKVVDKPPKVGDGAASAAAVDIIEFIKNTLQEKRALLTECLVDNTQIKTFDDILLDHTLDYLDRDKFESLMNKLNSSGGSPFENQCRQSLSRVYFNNKYYYNYFDDKVYCWKKNIFKVCTPIDYVDFANKEAVQELRTGLKLETKAYIYIRPKEGAPFLKIRDNKNANGYICINTSYLSIDKIKKRLEDIKPNVIKPAKASKSLLCFLLEIMLRTFEPTIFQRPFFSKN
jgi:superfamily II DNA or RNA helicase